MAAKQNKRLTDQDWKQVLEKGAISLQGQFLLGSNYTFLVTVEYQGCLLPAVYKPVRGEQPLWDFPEATLARREVAAYLLSRALGWDFIPVTVLREGPFGLGSLQQFIEYNPNYHYFNFRPADVERLRPVALFDLLANNADRKGSHVFFQKRTRRLYAIDHGLCFHVQNKLRTVIWNFAGEPFPQALLESLRRLRAQASVQLAALKEYLSPEEIEALEARLEHLLADPVYPFPPRHRRAFPYPPL
ncbi:MAG: SCO1664 family protein [Anaerolineales bacterium]|nr:SCO1664 family protein [Anaerolineales bacterium]MDW8228121.1 SCO1664 family protein [Anaerolineales bacterium]